jgi:hypothetical protein
MSHWNHRVVKRIVREFDQDVEWVGIHEVFYSSADESDPGWTEEPISVEGETVDELRETLERMFRALDRPIIDGTEKKV